MRNDYMNIKDFFDKISTNLKIGKIISEPERITGGFTHKMYKINTDNGQYIIKLLNPNIMSRETAMSNYNQADFIEEILKHNNIPAIYSLVFNEKKMQLQNGQFFYVYDWFDGKSLKSNEIKEDNCHKIGKVLADIHNIDLQSGEFIRGEIHVDFNKYIELPKESNSPIYEMLQDKVEILNESMNEGNKAIKNIPNVLSICHNDMDSKNVLWLKDNYRIIDLECLGYSNPYLELFELALCWSGYEECNINYDLFNSLFDSYLRNTTLDVNIDWETIYYCNFGRLEWLEFNIKRALMIGCNTKEEQELGINQVRETIKHVIYYDKVKNEILNNINQYINNNAK
ncbi:MAG TPA: hypothetical protein DDW53_00480, partial [Lachnoclostridium sp.]|nr:hypothetical protein [Lachnoclostridium sp.]